jgi:hypothetical protein
MTRMSSLRMALGELAVDGEGPRWDKTPGCGRTDDRTIRLEAAPLFDIDVDRVSLRCVRSIASIPGGSLNAASL